MRTTAPASECCAPLGSLTLSEDEAMATARVFAALADPHRVRIVNLLAGGGAMTEDEMIEPLELSQPAVSYHLKKLTEAGFLNREQRGQHAVFSFNCEALRTLATVADLRGVCC